MLNKLELFERLKQYNIHEVISFFNKYFDEYYIAGGCIRDLLFGRPVKDIDIFLNVKDNELLSITLDTVDTDATLMNPCNKVYAYIFSVVDFIYRDLTPIPIQIINMSDEVSPHIIKRFDSSICKVALSNKYELICTQDFMESYYRYKNIVSYTESIDSIHKANMAQNHINRISNKYPGIKVIDTTTVKTKEGNYNAEALIRI